MNSIEPYIGIGLFSALTSYDVHKSVQMYKDGNADYLTAAMEFYLDFVNLLIRFIEILSRLKKD
jgi:FtsH-binding integral membrane protein